MVTASHGRKPAEEATSLSGRPPTSSSLAWFDVPTMPAQPEYILFGRASGNQLGEFDTFEKAEEVFFRYVRADPSAADHLESWGEDGAVPLRIDPEKLRRVTAE